MPNENLRKLLRHMEQARTAETSDVMHGGNYHQTQNLKRPVGGKALMKKEAKNLGEKYAQHILKAEGTRGGNFWGDFKRGFDSVIKPAAKVAKAVAPALGKEGAIAKDVIEAVGYGQRQHQHSTGGGQTGGESFWDGFKRGFKPAGSIIKAVAPLAGPYGMAASAGLNAVGLGKKPKQKRKQSVKQQKRNALVRELMKEHGLTLPQASKYIKEQGLM